MSQLNIYLLGNMQAEWENGRSLKLSPTAQALFAYLVLFHKRSHRRESLADLFWREQTEKKARHCLSTALWRLKKELTLDKGNSASCIDTSDVYGVKFDSLGRHWVDFVAFEKKANLGLNQPALVDQEQVQLLEQAIQLYRGELLDGYYDEWVLQERERLNLLYLRCLAHLMKYYRQQGNRSQSITLGQKILQVDPLREQIHRELMQLYWENGQREQAIQQYVSCRQILAHDLNIIPMAETEAVFQKITGALQASIHNTSDETRRLKQFLQEIEQILAGLDQTQQRLRTIKMQITSFSKW